MLNLFVFLLRFFFFYLPHWLFVLPIFRLLFIKSLEGKENIPKNSNFIVAANHQNTLDHWILAWVFKDKLRKIHFVGRMQTLSKKILWGWFFFLTQTIPIDPGKGKRKEIVSKLVEIVKKGEILILYPEGNTNRGGVLSEGKTGVAEIALKAQVPILPIGHSVGIKRKIKIGKPIYLDEEIKVAKSLKEDSKDYDLLLRKITTRVMLEISKLSGQKYFYGD